MFKMSGKPIISIFMGIMLVVTSCHLLDHDNRKPSVSVKDLKNGTGSLIDKGDFSGVMDITRGMDSLFWLIYTISSPGNHPIMVASGKDDSWKDVWTIQPDNKSSVSIFNPRIWMDPDEKIWIFWTKQVKNVYEIWALTGDPGTNELVRSKPFFISDGILMGKPVLLSNGKFILSVGKDNKIQTIASFDHGKTWQHEGIVGLTDEISVNEAVCTITECMNGSLWMVIQTSKGTWESRSAEQGMNWNGMVASNITCADNPFFIQKLISGNILLVKQVEALKAYISVDNGQTWSGELILDDNVHVSNITGHQIKDLLFPCCSEINIIFAIQKENGKRIRMVSFTEDDVMTGKIRHYSSPFR